MQVQVILSFASQAAAAAFLSNLKDVGAAVSSPAPAAPAAAPAASGPTLEQLQAKLKPFMEKHGKDAVVALFAQFSAKKLSDVAKDKLGELDKAIENYKPAENLF